MSIKVKKKKISHCLHCIGRVCIGQIFKKLQELCNLWRFSSGGVFAIQDTVCRPAPTLLNALFLNPNYQILLWTGKII